MQSNLFGLLRREFIVKPEVYKINCKPSEEAEFIRVLPRRSIYCKAQALK